MPSTPSLRRPEVSEFGEIVFAGFLRSSMTARKTFAPDSPSWDTQKVITTKADHRKRIVLPQAKPGQVYSVQANPDGSVTLAEVRPASSANPKCRLAKEGGFTVVVPGQPINEQAIKELLADFP